MTEPPTPHPPQPFYLFFLFDLLRQRRIPPFKDGQVKYSPPPPKLDWTKLPEEFRWIAGAAEKYGKHQFHGDRVRFARRYKEEDRRQLQAVVRRLWSSQGVLEAFQQWCIEHPAGKHPETNLLNGLWELIVGLGEADDDKKPEWMLKRDRDRESN